MPRNKLKRYTGVEVSQPKSIAQQLLENTKLGNFLYGEPKKYKDGYDREMSEPSFKESANGQLVQRMGETAKDAGKLVATGLAFGNPLTASEVMAPLITGSQAYWIGHGINDGTQRIENIGEDVKNFVEDPSWQNTGAIVKEVPMLALDVAGAVPVAKTATSIVKQIVKPTPKYAAAEKVVITQPSTSKLTEAERLGIPKGERNQPHNPTATERIYSVLGRDPNVQTGGIDLSNLADTPQNQTLLSMRDFLGKHGVDTKNITLDDLETLYRKRLSSIKVASNGNYNLALPQGEGAFPKKWEIRAFDQEGLVGRMSTTGPTRKQPDMLPEIWEKYHKSHPGASVDMIENTTRMELGSKKIPTRSSVKGVSQRLYDAGIPVAQQTNNGQGLMSGEMYLQPQRSTSVINHYPSKQLIRNNGEWHWENLDPTKVTTKNNPVYLLPKPSGAYEHIPTKSSSFFPSAIKDGQISTNITHKSIFLEDGGYLHPVLKKGGSIHIKKKNRGKFTESAKRAGMEVQEYARHILANKDKYSSTLVKRANFARNAKKFKHENGGIIKYQNPSDNLPPLIQRVNKSKANFVQRLLDPNRKHIQNWVNPLSISTHKLGWATEDTKQGAFVYPEVQEINGELIDFTHPSHRRSEGINSAIERRDTVRMTPEQAKWFTENYKQYYPGFKDGGILKCQNPAEPLPQVLKTAATFPDWLRGTWSYLSGNKDSKLLESQYRPTKETNPNTKYYYRDGLNTDVIKNILGGSDYGKKNWDGENLYYKDFNDVWDRLSATGGRAERNTDNSHLGAYTIGIGEDNKGRYISYYDKFDWAPAGLPEIFHPYEIYNRIYEDEFNNTQSSLKNITYSGYNPSGKRFFKSGKEQYNHEKR